MWMFFSKAASQPQNEVRSRSSSPTYPRAKGGLGPTPKLQFPAGSGVPFGADQGKDMVHPKNDQVPGIVAAWLARVIPAPDEGDPVGVLLLLHLGQKEPDPLVAGPVLHEKIGRMGIGQKVAVGPPVRHDEGEGAILQGVGPGEDGLVHAAVAVGGGQHASAARAVKIGWKVHVIFPFPRGTSPE